MDLQYDIRAKHSIHYWCQELKLIIDLGKEIHKCYQERS